MSRRSRLFVTTAVKDWGKSPLSRVPDSEFPLVVEYLVIGGGGGGTNAGGGAGGYRCSVVGESSGANSSAESTFEPLRGTSYTVTVGAGGAASTKGSDSAFATITAEGGGASPGGGDANGGSGGSGSGGRGTSKVGGAGTANQGSSGGSGDLSAGGGGGGAGQAGANAASSQGGGGGNGLTSSITGTSVARGGGGGGAGATAALNLGGSGGGGNSENNATSTPSTGGQANTGGGGGGDWIGVAGNVRSGGSGVVIVRYVGTELATTTGSPTTDTYTSGGVTYRYYTFTGSGTITWS